MHVLLKWVESDPVFNALGMFIAGMGIFVLISLILYACGFLA